MKSKTHALAPRQEDITNASLLQLDNTIVDNGHDDEDHNDGQGLGTNQIREVNNI